MLFLNNETLIFTNFTGKLVIVLHCVFVSVIFIGQVAYGPAVKSLIVFRTSMQRSGL